MNINYQKCINFIKNFFVIILIFLCTLAIRIYAIEHKIASHCDETFTYYSSTPANISPDGEEYFKKTFNQFYIEYGKEYNIKELKQSLFGAGRSLSSITNDLKTLRNNNIERQHTNLYYSIIRIWNAGIDGTDYHTLTRHSAYLNLIFFVFSFFFMYKLLSLIKDDKKFISLGLFFAFISTGSISNTLLIREYELMGLFFIIAVYVSLKIVKTSKITKKNFILYPISYSLFLLSGYYALIFEGLLLFFITMYFLLKKEFLNILKMLVIICFTYLFTILIYPSYFDFRTNNEHYGTVINSLFDFNSSIRDILFYYPLMDITDYLFYKSLIVILLLVGIILIIYRLIKKKSLLTENKFTKQDLITIWLILISIFIWDIIVALTIPFKVIRYFLPSIPILSLLLVIITYRLKWDFKSFLLPIVIIVYLGSAFIPLFDKQMKIPYTGRITNLYTFFDYRFEPFLSEDEQNIIDDYKQQKILRNSDKIFFNFILSDTYPSIFYIPHSFYEKEWENTDIENEDVKYFLKMNAFYQETWILHRLDNNGIIRFEKEIPNAENYKYKEYFLFAPCEIDNNLKDNHFDKILGIHEQCIFFIKNK